jgi:aminocarboxymuconate-semialdehyde decarboxylase
MQDRRQFLKTAIGVSPLVLLGDTAAGFRSRQAPLGGRRRITLAGRRITVVDIHAHCIVPVTEIVRGTPLEASGGGSGNRIVGPERIEQMDRAGIDVQALTINGYWWYAADPDLAARIVRAQNEGLADIVRAHRGRFVALASVALQFPDLAAAQVEDAVTRLNLRGASIGGHVNGEDLSLPKYDVFWGRAAQLGVPVFMHPAGAENIVKEQAFRGRGDLGNIIGNPLETTYFLSRLIFDGTFDKHPRLQVIAPHGGGYVPSYLARTDVACDVRGNANCANKRRPREYLRDQIVSDSMVFTPEGLRHLVEEVGAGQVAYGTDMPFTWPDTLDVILQAPSLSDAQKEAILGANVMKLLRIAPVS